MQSDQGEIIDQQYPLPNFLIVGASRSGTTSLHRYLSEHPDIFVPNKKELRFFDSSKRYDKGLDSYRKEFQLWAGETAIGEASPPYFFHGITFDRRGNHRFDLADDAPSRIAECLPEAKILFTLRNPVDRAYSQYWKNRVQKREDASSFREAIELELAGDRTPDRTGTCWIYKNLYSIHLRRWFSLFPRSQCKIMIFEEWTSRPEQAMRDMAVFIGVDPRGMPDTFPVFNTGFANRSVLLGRIRRRAKRAFSKLALGRSNSQYPPLDAETREFLRGVFDSDTKTTERLLGRDLTIWQRD